MNTEQLEPDLTGMVLAGGESRGWAIGWRSSRTRSAPLLELEPSGRYERQYEAEWVLAKRLA